MKVRSRVTVNGGEVRVLGWQVGAQPGSPVETFQITPAEPATTFVPAAITAPMPVTIEVALDGQSTSVLANGHLDSVQDAVQVDQRDGSVARSNVLSGRSDTYKLLERGPRRDTVFVPSNIIEEVYPHGVRVFTLSGEQVIGYPPGQDPYLGGGGGFSAIGASARQSTGAAGGIGAVNQGPTLVSPGYKMTVEEDYVSQEQADACGLDTRYGPVEEWVESAPPIIVIFGRRSAGGPILTGGHGSLGGSPSTMGEMQAQFKQRNAASGTFSSIGFNGTARKGLPGSSTHSLIQLIAKKAGFTKVINNTPDLPMYEPLNVSAGSRWIDAIMTIVGPWNAQISVDPGTTTLRIFDIEAASVSQSSITIGGDAATAIRHSISRLPPYRSVDIIGTLRRGIRVRKDAVAPAQVKKDDVDQTQHIGPHVQMPYNVFVTRSYAPTSNNLLQGEDSTDWTSLTVSRGFFIDPESQQSSLVYQETTLADANGPISSSVYQSIRHVFDEQPHGSVQEQYGRFPLAGPGLQLLRRTTTIFNDSSELEGITESHTLTEGLVVVSVSSDGRVWKATPAGEASASGTVDLSAGSTDSTRFCAITESIESYQVVDRNVAVKTTVEVDYIGGRPPRDNVEVIFRRHRQAPPYDPRQRFCFPVNESDGEVTKSIAALYISDRRQAQMVRDRAARRGNQRHEEIEVDLGVYLPKVRQGMAANLAPTQIKARSAGGQLQTGNYVSGAFFVAGYLHVGTINQQTGAETVTTRVMLRSKF